MHIILSRAIWIGGEIRTAISQHIPDGVPWSDSVSGDGQTIASIVPGELSEDVVAAIKADRDVLDYLYIAQENGPLTEAESAKMQRSALRHGIPMDAMPETPTAADVAEAVKRRMLLSQIARENNFETAAKLEKQTIERMAEAGFSVDEIDDGDDPDTRLKKAQKKKAPPGG